MIQLPNTLTPVRYPGYYWCVKEHKLYSIKVQGVLRELKRRSPVKYGAKGWRPSRFSRIGQEAHYVVSFKSRDKYLFVKDLRKLTLEPQVLPLPAQKEQHEN